MTETYRLTAAAVLFALAAAGFAVVAVVSGPWCWWLLALAFVVVAVASGLGARRTQTG